ncbi:M15 family metallopeptidase [Bdellovibrio bacteriovorus]|uniref:M15 family metallopeptidase n=1 Tax=Bdellovibrio bacteriovorus TaxID=959 RepID=UPI0021D16EF3|nr:M15 family metallopeptidase [Bdellovibrio bacteriovorus]UXR64549.1 M15 family metallopeptidase [Bdellovibrio bacteriovorus]
MNSFYTRTQWIEENFMEIKPSSEVVLDLKYATTDNFMKEDIYAGFQRCFMSPVAGRMFLKACEVLRKDQPHLQFRIWDALRPRSIQARFFDFLAGTPFQSYVANPYPGSLHNFGMALDVTLQTKEGELLDMGTYFDDFRDIAQPKLEGHFIKTGELTPAQLENRLLLRKLLEDQGFKVLDHEWWHFNALPKEHVYEKHPILE